MSGNFDYQMMQLLREIRDWVASMDERMERIEDEAAAIRAALTRKPEPEPEPPHTSPIGIPAEPNKPWDISDLKRKRG